MLETISYSTEELLQERREAAVRSLIRAVAYALTRGGRPEDVGHFLFDSYRQASQFERIMQADASRRGGEFAMWHLLTRWGWCDDVTVQPDQGGLLIESCSLLAEHESVLGFHGVTRMDMETCMETFWRLSGAELGLQMTYTIGTDRDWAVIRPEGKIRLELGDEIQPFTPDSLAEHRRISVANGITASIGFAKHNGDEPEDLGRFYYDVWEKSGHYDRLREEWGYGNALAYARSLAQSRQIIYTHTEMMEDLDGFTISSPSWAPEIPRTMGTFGVLPDDVCRYYEGGGVAACAYLGLQYADQSTDRVHRVWIRAR